MKWRRYTKERDGLGLIVSSLLEDVLFPVAEEGWEVGGEEYVRKVIIDVLYRKFQCLVNLANIGNS